MFKIGLKTVFAVSLIFLLVGCASGEQAEPYIFKPCPEDQLRVLSHADSNEHGVEVSVCVYEDHIVFLKDGMYAFDYDSATGETNVRFMNSN